MGAQVQPTPPWSLPGLEVPLSKEDLTAVDGLEMKLSKQAI